MGIAKEFTRVAKSPIHVQVAERVSPTDVRILFPLLWADSYCEGDFVLHLEANSVLLQPVTYERVFHFGKPVLPVTRFMNYGKDQEGSGGRGVRRARKIVAFLGGLDFILFFC